MGAQKGATRPQSRASYQIFRDHQGYTRRAAMTTVGDLDTGIIAAPRASPHHQE
jgi:hypothetical protein